MLLYRVLSSPPSSLSPQEELPIFSPELTYSLPCMSLTAILNDNLYSCLTLLDQEPRGDYLLLIFRSPQLAPVLSFNRLTKCFQHEQSKARCFVG